MKLRIIFACEILLCILGSVYVLNENSINFSNEACELSEHRNISDCFIIKDVYELSYFSPEERETHFNELSVEGTSNYKSTKNGIVQVQSNLNVRKTSQPECISLENLGALTQTKLIKTITAPCRFDRMERPLVMINGTVTDAPTKIFTSAHIYDMQTVDSSDLQFKIFAVLQFRYKDSRLAFRSYMPNRSQPIIGESELRSLIWVPHIILANEHESSIFGTDEKDVLTSITPDGTIVILSRIQATLFCKIELRKFPFDEQNCTTIFESWMYNSSQLLLHWEQNSSISLNTNLQLTEYTIYKTWTNESTINEISTPIQQNVFVTNYSSISFTVQLSRDVGYYVMDYFLPSIMIVAISWTSFWLQADQTPARTTLGTSTMLSLITLSSSQQNNLLKVSYIKVSEIWFFGCTLFIFASLIEFAFVNTIWRRKCDIKLKKVKYKYIFKSTLTPTKEKRKRSESTSKADFNFPSSPNSVISFVSTDTPIIITEADTNQNKLNSNSSNGSTKMEYISKEEIEDCKNDKCDSRCSMTPHEVSLWIDRKARFIFPLTFILFNAIFWTFVYCL